LFHEPFRQFQAFIRVAMQMAFFYRGPKQAFEAWNMDEIITTGTQVASWKRGTTDLFMVYELV
jgi:hypothetical protein